MAAHAELSPSSASRWMACPGSVALSRGIKDSASSHSAEGTAMHTVAELCLTDGSSAASHVGEVFSRDGFDITFTADLAEAVQRYVDYVTDITAANFGELLVEQRLSISEITGEADAYGTSDAVVLMGDELCIIDLKGGMGVPVDADDNPQLMIYALAALNEYSLVNDFKTIRMVIHQPRLNKVSEWVIPVEQLLAFGKEVAMAAATTKMADAPLHPSSKACRWCKAKATCPAIAAEAMEAFEAVVPEDAPVNHLAQVMAKADLIEGWVKAVRAEVERRLLDGHEVPGFKLVQGKRGNRSWANPAEAEAWLKHRLKLDELYDFKLASPTTITKRLEPWIDANGVSREPVLGPRQQKDLALMITQKEGAPSVAPESDKRPALVIVQDEFLPV